MAYLPLNASLKLPFTHQRIEYNMFSMASPCPVHQATLPSHVRISSEWDIEKNHCEKSAVLK
eukprot:5566800-Prorocentrum_lima.AAC.1